MAARRHRLYKATGGLLKEPLRINLPPIATQTAGSSIATGVTILTKERATRKLGGASITSVTATTDGGEFLIGERGSRLRSLNLGRRV